MTFDEYTGKILKTEISQRIEQTGFVLEKVFCQEMSEKYNLSKGLICVRMMELCPELSLKRRRLNNDLKVFYHLQIKGCPLAYVPEN